MSFWCPSRKLNGCLECGSDKSRHAGRGLCEAHYSKWRLQNPEIKKKHYESVAKWVGKNYDKVREINKRATLKYIKSEKGKAAVKRVYEKRKKMVEESNNLTPQ